MSIFFKGEEKEVVLFSPLEGLLTYKGKPVADAKLELNISWKDDTGETKIFYSDQNGYFNIPKQNTMLNDSPMAQLVVNQLITVDYSGERFVIWDLSKLDGEMYAELSGKPQDLTCELEANRQRVKTDSSMGSTTCVWKTLTEEK